MLSVITVVCEKMLKETERIGCLATFLSLVAFQLGGARAPCDLPLTTPMLLTGIESNLELNC